MYPFLDRVPEDALGKQVQNALPSLDKLAVEALDRNRLYSVLFSLYGFDLLAEANLRHAMLLSLGRERLQSIAAGLGLDPSRKPFDVALRISNQPWRAGAPAVTALEDEFGVSEEFLPKKSDRDPAVEWIEPYSELPGLFDYQEEMASALTQFLSSPLPGACLLQLPTGAGKTRVAMEGVSRFLNSRESSQQDIGVLWMAHSEELCDQAVDAFLRTWSSRGIFNVRIVRYWGGYHPTVAELRGSFVVASYQKVVNLAQRAPQDFEKFSQSLSVVVIDEAHRALAPTVKSLIGSFRRWKVGLIGLTATPGRGQDATVENRRLANLFDRQLLRPSSLGSDPVRELQRRSVLARVRRTVVDTGFRIVPLSSESSRYDSLEDMPGSVLSRLAKNERRNDLIVETVRSHVEKGYPTLVFCCTVEHARELAVIAGSRGVRSAFLDCRMLRGRRRRVIAAFRNNTIDVLFNFGVLSTGFDAPNIRCVVIARPTSSIVLYSQMIGRGLRGPAVGGSSDFVLVDVRDNVQAFGEVGEVYKHFEPYWQG